MIADIEISRLATAAPQVDSRIVTWENVTHSTGLYHSGIQYKFSETVTWGDEFNYIGAPDHKKWGITTGNGYYGWGNRELEYFTDRPENIKVEDGKLKITARAELYKGFHYTSGKVVSTRKQRYGRYVIRAKMPIGAGLWPAIFGFGERHKDYDMKTWPGCGEFDIVEIKGQHDSQVNYNVHSGNSSGVANLVTLPILVTLNQFNEYRIDWTPEYIKWYFNGALMRTFSKNGKGYDGWPFDDQFDLNICLNVGGDFVGNNINSDAMPATMEIEYVRYFALTNTVKKNGYATIPIQPVLSPASAKISPNQSQTFTVTNIPANSTVHWYALGGDLGVYGLKGPKITITPAMLKAGGITSGQAFEFFVDFVSADGISSKATRVSLSVK
jgi:beta-glucanase (GH16 family)